MANTSSRQLRQVDQDLGYDTWKEIKTLAGPQGHQKPRLIHCHCPDGKSIASGSSETQPEFGISSNTAIREFALTDAVLGLSLSPDANCCRRGQRMETFTSGNGYAKNSSSWPAHTGRSCVALSANNQWLAVFGTVVSAK